MGKIIRGKQARRPFNSPVEIGLRSLFVLDAISPAKRDLQRLVSYDYLLVHSADVHGGPSSLHAAVPHRSGEILVRRQLLGQALDLMFAKEILCKELHSSGIVYSASMLTSPFTTHLKSGYASAIRERAKWLALTFEDKDDDALARFMASNLGKWGAEFSRPLLNEGRPS